MGELAKGKVVKEKYGAKLVFQEGGGTNQKNLPWEGYDWIFSEGTQYTQD